MTLRKRDRRLRHGFTMLELVGYLGMLAVIGGMAAQLLRSTFRTWRDSAAQQSAQTRYDSALHQLREDVWAAREIREQKPGSLTIDTGQGEPVRWSTDARAGGLSRGSARDPAGRNWAGIGHFNFSIQGPTLTLHVEPQPDHPGGDIVLVSQSMLLRARPQ